MSSSASDSASFTVGVKKPKITMAKRAGLHLPARSIKRQINHGEFDNRAGDATGVYLAAQLEYVAIAIVGAAADRANIFPSSQKNRKGVVSAQGIEALMRSDKTGTFATLLRDSTPFHHHTVCALDDEIVARAASKRRKIRSSPKPVSE